MANEFDKALWELKASINKVLVIEAFLESCIIFLLGYLLVSVAGFLSMTTTLLTAGLALLFFLIKSAFNIMIDKVDLVGSAYKDLHEELLTARDYLNSKNQVVEDLHKDAVTRMGKIEESRFFRTRSVLFKVGAIVALCFIILVTAPFNLLQVPVVSQAIDTVAKTQLTLSFATPMAEAGGPEGEGITPVEGELLGDTRDAVTGVARTRFEIPTSNFEVNLDEQDEDGEDFRFDSVFPTEIGTPDPEVYAESIPKEQQELVKNYFKIRAEG